MTNAEKYEEVFGMKLEFISCPCIACSGCKVRKRKKGSCTDEMRVNWWNSEYQENSVDKKGSESND